MPNPIVEGRRKAALVRAKRCTWCGAKRGQPCTNLKGEEVPYAHARRWEAAGMVQSRADRRRTGRPVGRPLSWFGRKNRTVPCPTCEAPAGEHCTTPTGKHTDYHRARTQAATEAS